MLFPAVLFFPVSLFVAFFSRIILQRFPLWKIPRGLVTSGEGAFDSLFSFMYDRMVWAEL